MSYGSIMGQGNGGNIIGGQLLGTYIGRNLPINGNAINTGIVRTTDEQVVALCFLQYEPNDESTSISFVGITDTAYGGGTVMITSPDYDNTLHTVEAMIYSAGVGYNWTITFNNINAMANKTFSSAIIQFYHIG